jgi:hypothetical protein
MNECCQDPENRREGHGPRGGPTPPDDVTVTYCIVCECRHFEASIDAMTVGLEVES